jgi:RHS repeat-associated protein
MLLVRPSGPVAPSYPPIDPYGVPRPGGTASSGIGYAGEYRDGTGLVNLRARSYDPVLGRFIGRDTFGGVAAAPQSANRYAYALANPLRYTDPSGQFVNNIALNPNTYVMAAMMVSPWFAIGYMGFEFATGYDPVNNRQLSGEERAINGVLAGLGVFGKAVGFLREALAASDAMAGTRLAGEAGGLIGDASAAGSAAERIGGEAAVAERAGAKGLFEEFGVTPGKGFRANVPSSGAKSFITYGARTESGEIVYIGRASGISTPAEVLAGRIARGHHVFDTDKSLQAVLIDVQRTPEANRGAEEFFMQGFLELGAPLRNAEQAVSFRNGRAEASMEYLEAFFEDLLSR